MSWRETNLCLTSGSGSEVSMKLFPLNWAPASAFALAITRSTRSLVGDCMLTWKFERHLVNITSMRIELLLHHPCLCLRLFEHSLGLQQSLLESLRVLTLQ